MKKLFLFRLLALSLFGVFMVNFSSTGFTQDDITFRTRRQKLLSLISDGILIIQSEVKSQENLHEFFVPNSDNHDFIYLTGLDIPGSTLILLPNSIEFSEILYVKGNPEEIREKTGVSHVFPQANLLPDLSNAFTDFSLLRYTQRIRKPVPSEISRVLYNPKGKKLIYFNYPRFVNLAENPPKRLEFIKLFNSFSPKYEIRDVSDYLDSLRMYHDDFGIKQIRDAVQITGTAIKECMMSAVPGMSEAQMMLIFNFTSHFLGAQGFGFSTSVRSGPRIAGEKTSRREKLFKAGELIIIDCGAVVNHYTADIKRTFPVSGVFSEEQKRAYHILKKVQEECIRMVRPGITMKELQEKAIQLLNNEGDYGKYFLWGTSHFVGMDVHDVGNNLVPFKPGIAITIEPGIVLPEFSVELEDIVICTETGYEWISEFIPREVDDIEKFMKKHGIGKSLIR